MIISNVFRIIQGHQITDEQIYNSSLKTQKIPIITGGNKIKGYWDEAIVQNKDLPCISYPTKANAGEAYIQTSIFDANNTAVMILKEEWKNKVLLEWFILKLPNIFLQVQTSKEGVSYLNKQIVEDFEIKIPSIESQKKEIKIYERLINKKREFGKIKSKIDKIRDFIL